MTRSNNDANDYQYLLIAISFVFDQPVSFRIANTTGVLPGESATLGARTFLDSRVNSIRTKSVCPARKSHQCKLEPWVPKDNNHSTK